jgi:serine acetyltransferase
VLSVVIKSIGANVTIKAGITIGEYAMIGLGAVVTRSVPNFGLVYGNPARLKGFVGHSGQPLKIVDGIGSCPKTEKRYRVDGDVCEPLLEEG